MCSGARTGPLLSSGVAVCFRTYTITPAVTVSNVPDSRIPWQGPFKLPSLLVRFKTESSLKILI